MLNIGIGGPGGRVILQAAARPSAPVLIEAPRISGVAEVGETLTVSTGRWSDDATLFAAQWRRDGVAIPAATTAQHRVTIADVETALDVVVTASNAARRSAEAVSEAVRPTPLLGFSAADWSLRAAAVPRALIVSIATLPWSADDVRARSVEWSTDAGATVTPTPATLGDFTISGLPGGAPASVMIRPVSDGRPQAWSEVKTATPLAEPPAMFAPSQWTLAATGVPGQLAVEVLALPEAYGSVMLRVERRIGAGPWLALGVLSGRALIDGLANDSAVEISLRAVSAAGVGAASDVRLATPFDLARAPSNLVFPTIAGGHQVGAVLRVDPGVWSGPAALSRQWRRNGVDIAGATGETYAIGAMDRGALLDCVMTAAIGERTATATAAQVAVNVLDAAAMTANAASYGMPSTFAGSFESGTWSYSSSSGWRRMIAGVCAGLVPGVGYVFSGAVDMSGLAAGVHALSAAVDLDADIGSAPLAAHVFAPNDNTGGLQAFSLPFVASATTLHAGFFDTRPIAGGANVLRLTNLRLVRTDGAAAARTAPRARELALSLTGTGTLALGGAVSHVEIDGPAGATMIPASIRAGLDAPADAHIYRVTSTSDGTAPGTLRHAVTNGTAVNNPGDLTHGALLAGPRVVVFDVAGVWTLGSTLVVNRPKTYVAGQTAAAHVILRGESVKIYASDVVIRHVSVIPDPPSSVTESANSIGFGVIAGSGSGQSISRVWIDQWFVANWADQAPVVYTANQFEVTDCYFTNGVVAEGFRAPNISAPWNNFEKANHNLGLFFGHRTRNNVALNNIIAGCNFRTPQVKAASHTAVMSNYIHDFAQRSGGATPLETTRAWLQPAPIQISNAADMVPEDVSAFAGGRAVTVVAEGNWIEPGRQTRQGGAFIAGAAIERPTPVSGVTDFLITTYHGDNRYEAGGANGWTLANIVNYEDGAGGTQALGANNRAITPLGSSIYTVASTPPLWTGQAPTHASETRAWTLAHAGPRPNDPHAMMDRLKTSLAAQATINANTSGARARLFRDGATDPSGPAAATDDFSGEVLGPTVWSPPASPFSSAPNGRTNVENALEALNVALGGTPWGNVDRPVTTAFGGKLTVSAAGTLSWNAAGAAAGVMARVTMADGGARTVSLTP